MSSVQTRPGGRGTDVLAPAAVSFVEALVRSHGPELAQLLCDRVRAQQAYLGGALPALDPETDGIRSGEWTCGPIPDDLVDRRVEITGPTERKLVINASNSGANVFMADFEDSASPTWSNIVEGQANVFDRVRGEIDWVDPASGKTYALSADPAVLMVRPRGLHLRERHFVVDAAPAPASLVDAGLFLHWNARALVDAGSGPYLYLAKLEHWREAAWWDAVLATAESMLGLPRATIKVTVLIETLPAAFQMDEVLWALRRRAVGLNFGRWDYLFSVIKTLGASRRRMVPDRDAIGMTQPFLRACTRELVRVAHRRGVSAIGGMAAQIPIKNDPVRNAAALALVREDKEREAGDGYDGTWVAHPGLVDIAREAFDRIEDPRELGPGEPVDPTLLLFPPQGPATESGIRRDLRISVEYLSAWLDGVGCVPLYNRMEDMATAEICRARVWQWVHHRGILDDGPAVSAELVTRWMADEVETLPPHPRTQEAAELILQLCTAPVLAPFLTLAAYPRLTD